jgi:tetratricopeptide (TPR) repeat protein
MVSYQKSRLRTLFNQQLQANALIILIAFLIYSNTLSHKYALDDAMVITHNQFTQKGFSGLKEIFTTDSFTGFYAEKKVNLPGGRYRPLSIATFAIEHQLAGNQPYLSHFVNLLIYILTGLMLYRLLRTLFTPNGSNTGLFNLPLIATLLFMVHPIHTEVVANIKGRDELLALLFSLLAWFSAIKTIDTNRWKWLAISFVSAFLGLLSKENAIIFVAIIPLSIYFFRQEAARKLIRASTPMALAAIVFLVIRSSVIDHFAFVASDCLMNNPFLDANISQKYATIVFTLGMYLKLLFIPYPLTFDYYPYHISLVNWGNATVIFSMLVYIGLLVFALSKAKKKSLLSFAIMVYLGALFLVSNLVVNIGVFMNERFAYQASVGFVIGIAWLFVWLSEKYSTNKFKLKYLSGGVLIVLLLTFSLLTFSRNVAWKDSATLFLTDVKTSANSAKSNLAAGGILLDSAMNGSDSTKIKDELTLAKQYLIRATEIDPSYSDAWQKLGTVHYQLNGDLHAAANCYFTAIKNNRGDESSYAYIHFIVSKFNNSNQKISFYDQLLKLNPTRADVYTKLGLIYGREKRDFSKAITCFKTAIQYDHQNIEAHLGMGIAFQLSGNYPESIGWLEKVLAIDSQNAAAYQLMVNAFQKTGNSEKAEAYTHKANQLKKQ